MFRKYFYIIFLLLIGYVGISQINDQIGTPFIYNYPNQITNSEPQNWAIIEDHRGIIYFGNGPETGVLEFDGISWRIINVSNHSTARSLAIDNLGIIYVGASTEFGYLAADSSGSMQYVSLTGLIPKTDLEYNNILKIHTTSHGVYFIATNVIFRYHQSKIEIIEGNYIQRFGFNISDILFVANEEEGILFLRDNKFEKLPYTKTIIKGCGRYVLMEYPDNQLLIATANNGIYIYDLKKLSQSGKFFENNTEENTASDIARKLKTDISKYLAENSLYTGIKIDDNAYAFGTLMGGVIIMDGEGNLIRVINKNRGLVNSTILSLYSDKAKNLWVGTINGISYVETGSPLTSFNELNGLFSTPISLIRHQGKSFVGTLQGIFYIPAYQLKLVDDNHILVPISNFDNECWSMFSFKNTLLASGVQGIDEINEMQAKNIYKTSEPYCFGYCNKFPDYLFLGLSDGFEAVKIKTKINTGKINLSLGKKFPEITDKIRKIVSDKHNSLWLTTEYSGIIRIRFNNENINDYQIFRYDTAHGLPQLNYNWVHLFGNEIIIGSRKGFYKPVYNQNNNVIKFITDTIFGESFTGENALIENFFETSNNDIYIIEKNTGVGILKDYKKTKNWDLKIFSKISEPYQIFYDKDSILWISTLNKGLFNYNDAVIKNYNAEFNTLIRSVVVGKDSLVFYGSFYDDSSKTGNYYTKILMEQPVNNIPEFTFDYNSVKFYFSSTFIEKPFENQFTWMLEGFDKEWVEWNYFTEEKYKKIREGEYTFKVKSKNIFGVESPVASYKFVILPPWHRTIWAYLAYLILFVLFIYAIVRLNSKRLKEANIRLEKIIKERTKEIREQRDQIVEQKQAITDSIQYAKRIQSAVLPPVELIDKVLPEHFILFKPRDIVSGDFYWLKQIDKHIVFTAADCTGHGVPGAFMSMLGVALLNEIVRRKEITQANQILDELRNQIMSALRQSGKEGEAKDGMDIALCILNLEDMKLQFAGAYNPLYLMRNGELIEFKGDKMPIGIHLRTGSFTNHEFQLQKGDVLYVFSDGFVDQFGGNKGRKFMVKSFKRLLTEIHKRPMDDQKGILDITITEWRGEREQIDDIVIFGVRI